MTRCVDEMELSNESQTRLVGTQQKNRERARTCFILNEFLLVLILIMMT